MTLRVDWKPTARGDLRRLDRPSQERILAAIERYVATGQGNVARLKGTALPEYRLRVGDWRVRFGLDVAGGALVVLHVLRRDKAYR